MVKVYNEKYQLRFYRLKLVLKHLLPNLKRKICSKQIQSYRIVFFFQIVVINYSEQTL